MLYYLKRETFARRQNDLTQGSVASQMSWEDPGKASIHLLEPRCEDLS